jgi:hypothetical protein
MTKPTASIHAIKNATASTKSTTPRMAKKTAQAKAVEQVAPPPLGDDADTSFANFTEMFADFKLPSGRRMAVSVVTQFIVLGTGVYSGVQLGAVLAVGAMVLTGSAFLSFLLGFVTLALGVYTSLIAAARIGKYIALGEIDNDIKTAKAWVSGKWSSVKSHFASSNEEPSHV